MKKYRTKYEVGESQERGAPLPWVMEDPTEAVILEQSSGARHVRSEERKFQTEGGNMVYLSNRKQAMWLDHAEPG